MKRARFFSRDRRYLPALIMLTIVAGPVAVADEGQRHRVVYQCSESGPDVYSHLLFSVAQLKEKFGDQIDIVVTCLGPGIHLLGKRPRRPVPPGAVEKMVYLDLAGVEFHACGNTMKALGWTPADMHEFVSVVPIGAEDLMLLQEQGYSYLKW
jgi:intracellular sulfur oxidation DsrE/DsrF family protein